MAQNLFQIIVIVAILVIAWYILERFSPDATVTLICKILIFLVALWVVVFKVLPLAGVSF